MKGFLVLLLVVAGLLLLGQLIGVLVRAQYERLLGECCAPTATTLIMHLR